MISEIRQSTIGILSRHPDFDSQCPDRMTSVARDQVQELVQFGVYWKVGLVICSTLRGGFAPATSIASQLGVLLVVCPEINEISFDSEGPASTMTDLRSKGNSTANESERSGGYNCHIP